MRVYELIEKLKKMPQFGTVYIDDGEYVQDISDVEHDDERDYVIIRQQ